MAQKSLLKAAGLVTDPNQLSSVPEGALTTANNVIIDRDNIIEPRRGVAQYGNTFGVAEDTANQLLEYKGRILIHNNNTLLFNDNEHNNTDDGDFLEFDGLFEETETGRRMRSAESNSNLFFTTNDGIKKISATSGDDFSTASGYIIDSGAAKALDVTGTLDSNADGFLPTSSEVAYRVVWGYRDANDNLLLGSPSARLVMSNSTQSNANVDLTFVIPQNIDTSLYFYQIYRTAVFTTVGSLTIDDIDPGDEAQLVLEDFVTAQSPGDVVSVTDIASEDFREGGLYLYTNPNSGSGIDQANEPPPLAKDINMYQSTLFYANTESRARVNLALLSVSELDSGTSSITIDDSINPAQSYTFYGRQETTTLDYSSYVWTTTAALNGKHALMNSAGDKRKYYLWYDNTKTTQTLDYINYIGLDTNEVAGTVIVIYTADSEVSYYIWYADADTIDPGTLDGSPVANMLGIKVDLTTLPVVTNADLASETSAAVIAADVDGIFDVTYVALAESFTIETESFDITDITSLQTLNKGFSNIIDTPANNDPDIAGLTGFRVNISRGVTTKAQLADASAAAILDQDTALDFTVSLNTDVVTLVTNNNGVTTDASDVDIANGFIVATTIDGLGEEAAANKVLLSAAASTSQQIDESARSLVNVINKNSSGTVYAFYISGANDLPGLILFESRDIGINKFTITADTITTGSQFNPPLPPVVGALEVSGEAEIKPNRLYFAKLQQPEAVPLLNFIDVGPEDKEISRILALRESLFILKEDGIYRLTGSNGVFAVDLFDESTKIIAPDSAVVLNNQIYCLTNQGIVMISDTGVSIISNNINNIVKLLSSSNYDFKFTTFGLSYETDRSYLLWVPSSPEDTVATQALRYSTVTNSFTNLPISKTCGLVNSANDKMYLGASDFNFIEQERKDFNRKDYADRQYDLSIPANSIDGTTMTLSSLQNVSAGDALVQTQNLTISQFNQILAKLDLDPGTGAPEETRYDFSSYSGAIPGDLHSKYFITFSASDNNKYAVFYDGVGTLLELDTLIYNDIADAIQVRVDISGAITTEDIALATKASLSTASLEFVTTHTSGNSYLDTVTTRNGITTDALDDVVNGIGNGLVITTTSQGIGNFEGSLSASSGDNLTTAMTNLAIGLDADPGVDDTDYLNSVTARSAIGSPYVAGTPTVVTEVGHQLYTGRLITTPNSSYIVTVIDDDNFSIDVTTTSNGTLDWTANVSSFAETQAGFNAIVIKLNLDTGVFYSNYKQSEDTLELEVLVLVDNGISITVQNETPFIEGPIILYEGIDCDVVYASDPLGNPSTQKHVREGTFIFEDNNFSRATVGYASDLSPGFETIDFTGQGKGDWGLFDWGQHNWGGGFSGVPLRTYIPRQKQRCRYIQAEFKHDSAREKFALYGISYTLREISEKAWR